ncbi:MAG: hypothetical protein ABJA71_09710 [Ginsengibacter sp.]
MKRSVIRMLLLLSLFAVVSTKLHAQNIDCNFKEALFNIDFGSSTKFQEFNFSTLRYYQRDYTICPGDGYFSFSSYTNGCFNSDWITLSDDHTSNDRDGKMMLVNASYTPAVFFNLKLSGFKASTEYEFSTWLLNTCRPNGGCLPLLPNISITLETIAGNIIAKFATGPLPQIANPRWKKYFGLFITPAGATSLILKMSDLTAGGCGNDFAMDDITFRECYKKDTTVLSVAKTPIKVLPDIKQATKKRISDTKPVERIIPGITKTPVTDSSVILKPSIKVKHVDISIPTRIITRENPVIKQIQVPPGELVIELYDNAEIDGDTVSIYHNNQLVISRAGLSAKPITLRISVDAMHQHHELVMVADNLGSIPPNTSLMIVTAMDKRYEIFISSTEQKNAKVVIDLKN